MKGERESFGGGLIKKSFGVAHGSRKYMTFTHLGTADLAAHSVLLSFYREEELRYY
jgi:hypothetical protein